MKFAFIAEDEVAFPIAVLCRVLGVSPSGYYAWARRPASARTDRDEELGACVRAAHAASKGRYGSPRVHAELRANGEKVGRKRVARLMKEANLAGRKRRKFRSTTDSNHAFPIAPNILERDFTTTAPNEAWVTDITSIWTSEGWDVSGCHPLESRAGPRATPSLPSTSRGSTTCSGATRRSDIRAYGKG